MALPTALDLINDAYDEIGVRGLGQTLGSDMALQALRRLTRMVQQDAIDRMTHFEIAEVTCALTGGQQSYTIGDGANLDVPRPNWIDHASIVQTSLTPDLEVPIGIATADEWSQVSLKTLTSTWPTFIYYNYAFSDPDGYGVVKTWPVYNGSPTGMELKLYVSKQVPIPATLTTLLAYPEGYFLYYMYRLAIALCPMNGITPSATTVKNAARAEQLVKSANVRPMFSVVDPALVPGWNRSNYRYRSDTEG